MNNDWTKGQNWALAQNTRQVHTYGAAHEDTAVKIIYNKIA